MNIRTIQHLKAPNGIDGTIRRLYLVTDATLGPLQTITKAYDECDRGRFAIPKARPLTLDIWLPSLNVSPVEYRRLLTQYS